MAPKLSKPAEAEAEFSIDGKTWIKASDPFAPESSDQGEAPDEEMAAAASSGGADAEHTFLDEQVAAAKAAAEAGPPADGAMLGALPVRGQAARRAPCYR